MKKILITLSVIFFFSTNLFAQTISIAAAHAQAIGNTVTVSGIVTNGAELGVIRYMQDGTGGIAVYSALLNSVNRGDIITVTGTLVDYNNLLELNPVSNLIVNSTSNPLPVPNTLTPNQLGEDDESELVQLNNVIFANGGGVFAGNTTYAFTANGENGIVYLNTSSLLAGQAIPAVPVTLTAICSQYQSNYQLIPRTINDLVPGVNFYITSQPVQSNISTSGFDINWTTNIAGSSSIQYGHTAALELGTLNGAGGSSSHTVSITGSNASDLFYVKAYSVSGTDTAYSGVKLFITASNSSGTIKAYFNRTVNNSVAIPSSNLAIRLNNSIDDTLAAYINRAQSSIDIAIYTFDNTNTSVISQAINSAYSRGVSIRIIADGSNVNSGLTTLNGAIPVVTSPTNINYTIMHNKFVIIDAHSINPNLPVVWTGSTNWSDYQITTDANNVIIFQDQSLAKAYTLEFNEMWGSETNVPNATNQKFGQYKTDNTPHEFLIGGKRVENYFSPSDGVNDQIIKIINTANNELYFSLFSFTRFDLASAIADRAANFGVYTAGLVDDSAGAGQTAFTIIQSVIGNRMMEYNHTTLPGILHHKYMIVDQSHSLSDPLVLTGSHNWSTNADTKNDENTVIVHDPLIANQYYQEFYQRYIDNGGISLGVEANSQPLIGYIVYPNPANELLVIDYTLMQKSNMDVQVYDLQGKLLVDKKINSAAGSQSVSLSLKNLTNGLYFLKLTGDGFSAYQKIIIEK